MKFTYNGEDERVFPTISLVVSPGETFDAPDYFMAANVVAVSDVTPTSQENNPITEETTPVADVATPDTTQTTPTVGE